MPRAV
jgi:hypothetical protein